MKLITPLGFLNFRVIARIRRKKIKKKKSTVLSYFCKAG